MKIGKSVACGKVSAVLCAAFPLLAGTPATAGPGLSALRPSLSSFALGGSFAARRGDFWAPFTNPALLATCPASASVSFFPSQYGLEELACGSGVCSFPIGFGGAGVAYSTSGCPLYRESIAAAAFGGMIDDRVRAGVALRYVTLSIERYGSTGMLCVDAGTALDLFSGVTLGMVVESVNEPRVGRVLRERLPLTAAVGIAATVTGDVSVTLDAQTDPRFPVNACGGIEWTPLSCVSVRIGGSSVPRTITAGAAFRAGGITIEYGFREHPDLGSTHGMAIAYIL